MRLARVTAESAQLPVVPLLATMTLGLRAGGARVCDHLVPVVTAVAMLMPETQAS
jgi:hypothetical protein